MRIRLNVTCCFAAVVLLFGAGCERGDSQAISSEADEPGFRDGRQLVKQGRSQEALAAYLKVIAKRGESAPESHLEAGLLYLQEIKDPLAAIYHFRKYLELQPNSRQAPLVKQRIDAALREFARTLPAQPLENVRERDEFTEQIGRLQRENDELKAELAALRGGVVTPTIRTRAALDETVAADNNSRSDSGEPAPRPFITPRTELPPAPADSPVSAAPDAESAPVVQAAPAQPPPTTTRIAPTKPTPPASAGRTHTVVKGDTLFSLAQKYYGSRSKWRDIYAANRDKLPSENSLRLGMELTIP